MTTTLRTQTNPLTPDEYKRLLPRIGLSIKRLARMTGKSDTAVRHVLFRDQGDRMKVSAATAEMIHRAIYEEIVRTDEAIGKYLKADTNVR
jgi:hypothetical protein